MSKSNNSRFLQYIILNILFLPTILKHFRKTFGASHTTTNTGADLGWMHILVQLVRIGDTGLVESFRGADEGPQCRTICLGNDIGWYTISTGIPASRYLTRDSTAELESFGNED